MGNRRAAAVSTLIGTLASTGVVALQFLLLIPLFLRYIAEKIYGAWLAAGDLLVWMQAFDLGLPNLMIQKIGEAHGRSDEEGVISWFQAGFLILFGLSLVLVGIVVWLSAIVPGWLNLHGHEAQEITKAMRLAGIAVGGTMVSNAIVGYARGVQDTKFISALSTISMVVGALVTIECLFLGYGVLAIAMGMGIRAFIILGGGWLFLRRKKVFQTPTRISRECMKETLHMVPLMAMGGIGFMLANQGELVVVGKFISTDIAIIYMLTRKLADLTRTIVDSVTWSLFGAIAHLAASSERPRFWGIFQDLVLLRRTMAIFLASTFVLFNPAFVQVWAGKAKFGGYALSFCLAVQLVLATESFFVNYVYKAMGALKSTSLYLLLEGALRVCLAVVFIPVMGVFSVPVSAMATSLVFSAVQHRQIRKQFLDERPHPFEGRLLGICTGMLAVSGLVALLHARLTLTPYLGLAGLLSVVFLGILFLLLWKHPALATLMPGRFQAVAKP